MGNGENIGGSLLIMRLMPYGHWQRIEEIKQERKIMLKEGINEERGQIQVVKGMRNQGFVSVDVGSLWCRSTIFTVWCCVFCIVYFLCAEGVVMVVDLVFYH